MFETGWHPKYLGFEEENSRRVLIIKNLIYEDLRLWSAIQEVYDSETLRNYFMDYDVNSSLTFDDQKENAF